MRRIALLSVLLALQCLTLPAAPPDETTDSTPTASTDVSPVVRSSVDLLAVRKDYRAERVASTDRPGNADFLRIKAGQTTTIAELQGPGEITHLWTTIASPDKNHLRNIVLRIYYNGNSFPSVESPIGDFYGLGMSRYYYFNNPVQAIGTTNGMNAFWPMPFEKSARVEITNEGDKQVDAFYYYVDWRKLPRWSPELSYFHAQYRQAYPNESGKPYLILDTSGAPGHYVGVSLSILTQVAGWWGEGDDMITVDDETTASLWGTGSEDYFAGAWGFGETFYTDYFGMPLRERMDQGAGNYWNVYRLHLENPIAFKNSVRVEIEHGGQGFDETRAHGRNNSYSSVAYWYMAEPVTLAGELPPAKERIARMITPPVPEGVLEPLWESKVTGGGVADLQEMAEPGPDTYPYLNNDQLFMHDMKEGSVVALNFETTQTLSGPAVLRVTKAPDYGRVRIELDDLVLAEEFNAFSERLTPWLLHLGKIELPAGPHTLRVRVLGKDEHSRGYNFGIDYLRIGGESFEVENRTPGKARRL